MSIFVFQVEIEDDSLENPLEISITRSPVKRRPRLGDQNHVRSNSSNQQVIWVSKTEKFLYKLDCDASE
jgi:hypothetical protein